MAYQENKPLPTDRLKDSQADIQANFISNKVAFDQNHVTFDAADTGKHKFIQMPVQSVAPVTSATELALYTKSVTGVPQLFLRRASSGDEVNFTSSTAATIGTTTLPSGLILKWGTVSIPLGNDWNQVMFSTAFPNNCFCVQATAAVVIPQPSDQDSTASVILDPTFTTTYFWIFNRRTDAGLARPYNCTYFAIGN